MSPLLLPIVLLLFSEFSKNGKTRFVSRWFLYGYSFSVLIYVFYPTTTFTIICSGLILLISNFYIIHKIQIKRIYLPILLLSLLHILNLIILLIPLHSIHYYVPVYTSFSNIILRELTILTVTLCNYSWKKDLELNLILIILYFAEYCYLWV